MIGWSSGFCFEQTGGSTSFGRRRVACAIFVCTSWSAASMSRPSSNSTVTVAESCLLTEEMSLIPSTVMHASSTTSTTSLSITSGAAPRNRRLTVTCGKSTSGILLTPRRVTPMPPNTSSAAMSIHAKTGFWMETSLRRMTSSRLLLRVVDDFDGHALLKALRPVDDEEFAGLQALQDLDLAALGVQADLHRTLRRLAADDDVRDEALLRGEQGALGNDDRIARVRGRHGDLREEAG